jgi:acyl-CoA reductase-like NAD-dependent aldehyde dehydrogenase
MESRKLGDPSDRETFQGPQVDKAQQERIATFLEAGAKDGKVVTGGKTVSINGKVRGRKFSVHGNKSDRILGMLRSADNFL